MSKRFQEDFKSGRNTKAPRVPKPRSERAKRVPLLPDLQDIIGEYGICDDVSALDLSAHCLFGNQLQNPLDTKFDLDCSHDCPMKCEKNIYEVISNVPSYFNFAASTLSDLDSRELNDVAQLLSGIRWRPVSIILQKDIYGIQYNYDQKTFQSNLDRQHEMWVTYRPTNLDMICEQIHTKGMYDTRYPDRFLFDLVGVSYRVPEVYKQVYKDYFHDIKIESVGDSESGFVYHRGPHKNMENKEEVMLVYFRLRN